MRTFLTILCLLFFSLTKAAEFDTLIVSGVNTGMIKVRCKTTASQNRWALVKFPKSWNSEPTKKYITVFFWHGSGEVGSGEAGLNTLSNQGLPRVIRNGQMPDSFYNYKTGQYVEILFISIQQASSGAPLAVSQMDYARDNNTTWTDRIDYNNIFHTGLSLGGRGSFGYFVDGQEAALANVRGIVAMSAPEPSGTKTLTQANGPSARQVPVYLLWDLTDAQSPSIQPWNKKVRDTLNKYVARQVTHHNYTSSPPHGGWINQYTPTTRRTLTLMDGTTHNMNVYEWMVYHSSTTLPSSNAGEDKVIVLPTNFVTLYGATIGDSREWTQIIGPNSASINTPTSDTTTITGMIEGIYVFRLRATNGGDHADDFVTVGVNPEPVPPVDPDAPKTILIRKRPHKVVFVKEP